MERIHKTGSYRLDPVPHVKQCQKQCSDLDLHRSRPNCGWLGNGHNRLASAFAFATSRDELSWSKMIYQSTTISFIICNFYQQYRGCASETIPPSQMPKTS